MKTVKNPDPNSLVYPARINVTTRFSTGINITSPEDVPGLSKRELFAAMAMQGMLSTIPSEKTGTVKLEILISNSIGFADALIEELNKPSNKPLVNQTYGFEPNFKDQKPEEVK